jgi:hypothetical protein
MSESEAFEFVCEELALRASLDRLVARGTVRIAVKRAGLDARIVTAEQMADVAERVLPYELTDRGVAGGDALCADLARRVRRVESLASRLTAGRLQAPAPIPRT